VSRTSNVREWLAAQVAEVERLRAENARLVSERYERVERAEAKRRPRCAYCGRPAHGYACHAHADLAALEMRP
jgi:hypothetical protein